MEDANTLGQMIYDLARLTFVAVLIIAIGRMIVNGDIF